MLLHALEPLELVGIPLSMEFQRDARAVREAQPGEHADARFEGEALLRVWDERDDLAPDLVGVVGAENRALDFRVGPEARRDELAHLRSPT